MIKTLDYSINIELTKKTNIVSNFTMKQNDNKSNKLIITLTENDKVYDLTNLDVKIFFKKSDNTKVFQTCIIIDAPNGLINCILSSQALACTGNVACELAIYGTDEEVLTSTSFIFTVVASIRDDSAIESSNEFTALTDALNSINDAVASIPSVEQLNNNLQSNISTGNILKTDLDNGIQNGNILHETLQTNILTADIKDTELKNTIASADTATYSTKDDVNTINTQLAEMAKATQVNQGGIYAVDGSGNITLASKTGINAYVQFQNINSVSFKATSASKWMCIAYCTSDTTQSIWVNLIGLATRNTVYVQQGQSVTTTISTAITSTQASVGDYITVTIKSDRISFLRNSAYWFDVLYSTLTFYTGYTYCLGFASSSSGNIGDIVAQLANIPQNSITQRIFNLENKILNSKWTNKNYIAIGDSITYGVGASVTTSNYVSLLSSTKGFATTNNTGISGASVAKSSVYPGNGSIEATITSGSVSFANTDIVTILAGTNDFKLNVTLGTLGVLGDTGFVETTFYSAYRKMIEYILGQKPNVKIYLMTPLQRDNASYDINYTNSAGFKLIDYVNAVIAIGQMYALPILDLYSKSGFVGKYSTTPYLTMPSLTIDGLHPNDAGHARVADMIGSYIENN